MASGELALVVVFSCRRPWLAQQAPPPPPPPPPPHVRSVDELHRERVPTHKPINHRGNTHRRAVHTRFAILPAFALVPVRAKGLSRVAKVLNLVFEVQFVVDLMGMAQAKEAMAS